MLLEIISVISSYNDVPIFMTFCINDYLYIIGIYSKANNQFENIFKYISHL